MLRVVVVVAVLLAIFGPFNAVTIWQLRRIHPRRRPLIAAAAIVGNLMWLFFPILNARTDFSRWTRAILGPPWFAWQCFAIVYAIFILTFGLRRQSRRFVSRVFLWTTIVGGLAGLYGALVPLRVVHVTIALDNLPQEAEGTRLALITDLHTGLFSRPSRLRTIFRTAQEQRPDAILLGGDNIDDDPYFTPKLLAATSVLDPNTPLVAVLGNHEMYGAPHEFIDAVRGSRIRLLVNEGTAIRNVWIAGLSDYAAQVDELKPNVDEALSAMPPTALPILFAHQPKAFDDAQRRGIPLTLVGHTHGGQLGIPRLHICLAGAFLRYHMGWYERGGAQLYVNTGTGYWLLPFRLGVTPEITLVELRRRRAR